MEQKLEKFINNQILKAQPSKNEPQLFKEVKQESELIKALTKAKPETKYEPKLKNEKVSEVNYEPTPIPEEIIYPEEILRKLQKKESDAARYQQKKIINDENKIINNKINIIENEIDKLNDVINKTRSNRKKEELTKQINIKEDEKVFIKT